VNDDEFLAALESSTLAECEFGHSAHVRAAYLYLRSMGFARALEKIQGAIRRYAASLCKPDRYHETITSPISRSFSRHSTNAAIRVAGMLSLGATRNC